MDDVTWLGIKLRHPLESNGVITSAEEFVADMSYLARAHSYFSGDHHAHERQMLDDWFRARFVEHRMPR